MKKILFFLLFMVAFQGRSFAQYLFDLKGKNLADVRKLEKSVRSKTVEPSTDYVSEPGVGQPIIFRRTEKLLPDLLVYYFPNAKDSTINHVLYEWDESNFGDTKQAVKQPLERLKPYIDKYLSLTKQAEAYFGPGETRGSVENLSLIETGRFKRTDSFFKNGTAVEMYIVLSNKEQSSGIINILPTHRIRMYVRTADTPSH